MKINTICPICNTALVTSAIAHSQRTPLLHGATTDSRIVLAMRLPGPDKKAFGCHFLCAKDSPMMTKIELKQGPKGYLGTIEFNVTRQPTASAASPASRGAAPTVATPEDVVNFLRAKLPKATLITTIDNVVYIDALAESELTCWQILLCIPMAIVAAPFMVIGVAGALCFDPSALHGN